MLEISNWWLNSALARGVESLPASRPPGSKKNSLRTDASIKMGDLIVPHLLENPSLLYG
jgi:hypothetical protein